MSKFRIIILLFVLTPSLLLSQNQDKLWMMGYGCCGPNFSGINMDFRSGSLVVSSVVRYFNFAETNGQMCDSAGNFLFSSNGIYVSNALDDTMLNGSGLNPSDYTAAHTLYGLHIPQANLVIPMPGDPTKYYLFHETSDDYNNTFATFYLYYSIVDMTLDGGLGGVIQKNTILLHDSLVDGELTACKHANGRDWWMLAHKFESDTFYKFLVTPSSILGPWIDETGSWRTNYFGQTVFSQDGSKFVYYEPNNDLKNFYSSREVFSGNIEIPFNTIVTATLERNGFIRILNTEPLNIPSACINNNGNYNNNCQSIPLYNCESHYSPFDNYSSVIRPISTNEFENIMNTLNNISFDSSRLNVAKQILSSKYVTTDQVIRILQLFTFDSSRLDIAKFAYNRTVDKSHYFQTYNSFTFDSSVNELSNYIGQMG